MTKMFENAIKAVKPDSSKAHEVIPYAYDISLEDFSDLLEMVFSRDHAENYQALVMAFEFGFVMGNRATHSRGLKRL